MQKQMFMSDTPQNYYLVLLFGGQLQSIKKIQLKLVPRYLIRSTPRIKPAENIVLLNTLQRSRHQSRADPSAAPARQEPKLPILQFSEGRHCSIMNSEEAETKPPDRKLVSVRRVARVKSLGSSQTHEVVMIDGWPVVVRKGQFTVGEEVLYFAIDCIIPQWDIRYKPYRFSQFFVKLQGQTGWTVQTVKYEGHVSQGMVFALDDSFPEITRVMDEIEEEYFNEFDSHWEFPWEVLMSLDLKDYLKVRKWSTFCEYINTQHERFGVCRTEISIDPQDGGVNLGRSPSFLPATKSERVQNIPRLWETHGNTEFQITEILDGIPMIFYDVTRDAKDLHSQLPGILLNDKAENGVRHRIKYGVSIGDHDHQETEASISWKAVREQGILNKVLNKFKPKPNFGLAGVLCGANISGNPLMIKGHNFYVYAVCDEKFKAWKTTDNQVDKWEGLLKSLPHVTNFATRIRLSAFAKDLDELMMKAQGASCVSDATTIPAYHFGYPRILDSQFFNALYKTPLLNKAINNLILVIDK